jgi:hypothetical protein
MPSILPGTSQCAISSPRLPYSTIVLVLLPDFAGSPLVPTPFCYATTTLTPSRAMSSGPVSVPECAKTVAVNPAGTVTPPVLAAAGAALAGVAKPNAARRAATADTGVLAARRHPWVVEVIEALSRICQRGMSRQNRQRSWRGVRHAHHA